MIETTQKVRIIGGGLAGSEAAWQCIRQGVSVELYEMRPSVTTKAHRSGLFAELVCSNSFRGKALTNAVGLLKEELICLQSLIMEAALVAEVPAGGALAVDRHCFSGFVDQRLRQHPLVTVCAGEVTSVPQPAENCPVIIATGPLTSRALALALEEFLGSTQLAFFDAISPILLDESIDKSKLFLQSRYDKGGDHYWNIPLTKDEYYQFVEAVQCGEKFSGHEEVESDSTENLRPFEGCMPIEDMVLRGPDTLLFGPMKPVGLTDPRTGRRPYAVIQLRQDDKAGTLWSMVGFQTRLKQSEQMRIFRSLPGLMNAEFVRLGSVHRNTFINSPQCLEPTLESRKTPGLFFAGQITGVEGYVESTAGGLVAGLNAVCFLKRQPLIVFPPETAIGALLGYISDRTRKDFQPMNVHFGLMPSYQQSPLRDEQGRKRSKADRRTGVSEKALSIVAQLGNDQ